MLEILLIRHGQTDWNRSHRIMGHRPVPLNASGRSQARAVARALCKVPLDLIITSPFRRAVETARVIARGRRVPLEHSPAVAEIGYGLWIGRTFEEVREEKNFKIYHTTPKLACAPGGEKMTAVHRRAVGLIEGLRKRYKKGRVAIVSHADVIKAILIHYLGLDLNELLKLRIDNGALSLLWFDEARHRVMSINCPASPGHLFSLTDQLIHTTVKKKKGSK